MATATTVLRYVVAVAAAVTATTVKPVTDAFLDFCMITTDCPSTKLKPKLQNINFVRLFHDNFFLIYEDISTTAWQLSYCAFGDAIAIRYDTTNKQLKITIDKNQSKHKTYLMLTKYTNLTSKHFKLNRKRDCHRCCRYYIWWKTDECTAIPSSQRTITCKLRRHYFTRSRCISRKFTLTFRQHCIESQSTAWSGVSALAL